MKRLVIFLLSPYFGGFAIAAEGVYLTSHAGGGGTSGGGGGDAWENYNDLNPKKCGVGAGPDGAYKVSCQGGKPLPKLRFEHHLWLPSPPNSKQEFHIDIPNYSIEDVIKAAFKSSPEISTLINLLLHKPTYEGRAEYDQSASPVRTAPQVNFAYEAAHETPKVVHWGSRDNPFQQLTSKLIEPSGSGSTSTGVNNRPDSLSVGQGPDNERDKEEADTSADGKIDVRLRPHRQTQSQPDSRTSSFKPTGKLSTQVQHQLFSPQYLRSPPMPKSP